MKATSIIVRRATPEDAESIVRVHHSAVHCFGPEYYSRDICEVWSKPVNLARIQRFRTSLNSEENFTFVAEFDGTIAGFSRLSLPNTISAVYVHADYARRGIGNALLLALEQLAISMGIVTVQLPSSLAAEKFYVKNGYQIIRQGTHQLSSGLEMVAVFMEKYLQ